MARKRETAFQKDSVLEEQEIDESSYDTSFVLDPAKLFDELPQPFRLIDKTVNYVFDKAWETIQELELRSNELGLGGKLSVFDCAEEMQDFCQPILMCASLDGHFIFLAAENGFIYALNAGTFSIVACSDELQGIKIETLSTGHLDENKHLVCVLMKNGTAATFVLSGSDLHLVVVFNENFGTKGSVTNYISVSFDGNYLAVGWRIPLKSSWLEVYKIPKEFWCNEINVIEEKLKQDQGEASGKEEEETTKVTSDLLENDSSDSENESTASRQNSPSQSGPQTGYLNETSFTKPNMILKIRAPTDPIPNPASNVTSALKNIDQDFDVIGTGTNHVLLQSYFDHSDKVFKERHQQYLQYHAEKLDDDSAIRLPTVHFLTPGRFVSSGMLTSPDQVNTVVTHWSGACHGLVYSLVKSSKDIERKPDVVLTTSSKILCSNVCKSFVSFGTENNNIITWNKLTGLPLTIVNLPSTSTITALHFIPTIKEKNCTSFYPKLLVCCADGDLFMVEYGDDGQTTTVKLLSSSFKMRDPVVQVTCLLNLSQLVLIQRNSGKIMLLDVSTKTLKCQIGLAKPLTMLNGFCYTHVTSTLYMKGGRKDEYNEEVLPESVGVYKMKVDSFPVVKVYLEDSTKVETNKIFGRFDERVATIEQERISTYEKRQRNHKSRWRQLEGELNRMKRPAKVGQSLWFSETIEV